MEGMGNPTGKKELYEGKLWKKAEDLSELRKKLQEEADEIYIKVQKRDVNAVGLHAEEVLQNLQNKYFEIQEEIAEVKETENKLQKALEDLSMGKVDERLLISLVGEELGPKLSKRKKRIMEERQRTGIDPRSGDVVGGLGPVDTYIMKQQGAGSYKLTTGRHLKGIKGNLGSGIVDAKSIERQFFQATKDTHGGKAKFGKDGRQYVSKSGKRIRKV